MVKSEPWTSDVLTVWLEEGSVSEEIGSSEENGVSEDFEGVGFFIALVDFDVDLTGAPSSFFAPQATNALLAKIIKINPIFFILIPHYAI